MRFDSIEEREKFITLVCEIVRSNIEQDADVRFSQAMGAYDNVTIIGLHRRSVNDPILDRDPETIHKALSKFYEITI